MLEVSKINATQCEEFRTISLVSHASKILTAIILHRIEQKLEESLSEDQFGFRRGRGTREAILALRLIIQKNLRKKKKVFITFSDLEKAFDNVNWNKMFAILKERGIKWKDRRVIWNLYKNETAVIKMKDYQEEARIKKGVRQGCNLSPILFNAYVQQAIDELREETNLGIKVQGMKIDMMRFADDIAVLTEDECDMNEAISQIDTIFLNRYNLKINKNNGMRNGGG